MVFADAPAAAAEGEEPARVEEGVLAHFRRLIHLRRDHAALRTGEMRMLLADDTRNVLAYARTAGEETLVVVINDGDHPQTVALELGGELRDLLDRDRRYSARDGKVAVPVEPGRGVVLRLERP